MLLLTIVAFFATTAFYSAAKHRGLQPGRAAMLPFVVLGILLISAHFGGLLLTKLLMMVETSESTAYAISLGYNLFLLCTYLAFIRKNWVVLNSHPVINDTDHSPS